MSDLISREELKKAMYHEVFEKDSNNQRWDSGCWIRYKTFERILASIPSRQPEQKSEWINNGVGIICSNCYYKLETTGLLSRCPFCGAKMD